MNLLPVQRAGQLSALEPQTQWLIEDLWSDQAVGILGGEPKCCKSFLALDIALSVASATPCLRQFGVGKQGSVLLYPAEDSLPVVRERLEGIAAAGGLSLAPLPIEVITAPSLRLDSSSDRERLANTLESIQPRLLILDPLIRLHRVDENDASKIAGLLSFLRQLQRQFQVAVLLVHHARKDSASSRPGQALRGSSELHGWGDSNLYLRRRGTQLTLWPEHRAAASIDPIALELTQNGSALALSILKDRVVGQTAQPSSVQRVRLALSQLQEPVPVQQLRKLCAMRTASVCSALAQLTDSGLVRHDHRGYLLNPGPVSHPTAPQGKGNGKPPHSLRAINTCSSGG